MFSERDRTLRASWIALSVGLTAAGCAIDQGSVSQQPTPWEPHPNYAYHCDPPLRTHEPWPEIEPTLKPGQQPPASQRLTPQPSPAIRPEEVTRPFEEQPDDLDLDFASSFDVPSAPSSIAPGMIGDFLGKSAVGMSNSEILFTKQIKLVDSNSISMPAVSSGGPFFFDFSDGFAGLPGSFRFFGVVPASIDDSVFNSDPNTIFGLQEDPNLEAAIQKANPNATSVLFISGHYQLGIPDPPTVPSRNINTDNDDPIVPPGLPGADLFDVAMIYEIFETLNTIVDIPNPTGGAAIGRIKIAENNSPIPRKRVFLNYSLFYDVNVASATRLNINRFVFGYEQPFLFGLMSAELRLPFAGTINSDQVAGQGLSVGRRAEMGNLGLVLKALVVQTNSFGFAVGMGTSFPTARDARVSLPGGRTLVRVDNEAVLIQPFAGLVWAPNESFFFNSFAQLDFDANGNPVLTDLDGSGLRQAGVLTDSELLIFSTGMGYWLYRDGSGTNMITGIASILEMHYTTSIGEPDMISVGNTVIGDLAGNLDVLNLTLGTNVEFSQTTDLRMAIVFPLRNEFDRQFDWEAQLQLNHRLGPTGRTGQ